MDTKLILAVVCMLLLVYVLRSKQISADKPLEDDKKSFLQEIFTNYRMFTLDGLVAILVLYFIINRLNVLPQMTSTDIFIALYIALVALVNILTYNRFKTNGFPCDFTRSYLFVLFVRFLGIMPLLLFEQPYPFYSFKEYW